MKTETYNQTLKPGTTQNDPRGTSQGVPNKDEILKRVEAAGTPGASHRALEPLIGKWRAEVKCWMDPDGAPESTQGEAEANWKFNGRFLEEDFNGVMMGRPFSGQTLIGYDNSRQKYNSVWISDTQTSMFISEGTSDSGGKTITFWGEASCPATGRVDLPMRTVLKIVDQDTHVLEMYDESRGGGVKTMEILYTRQ